MTAIDEAIRSALGKLQIAFEHDLSDVEGTIAVFTEALRDMAPLDIEGAVVRVIRNERYFPRPSILRGHALEEQLARTVWVTEKRDQEDRVCSLCGAQGYWLRGVQQPEPDPRWWPARLIENGTAAPRYVERLEILHSFTCPIRHRDQGISITTNAA
jgi:hypothetical protein